MTPLGRTCVTIASYRLPSNVHSTYKGTGRCVSPGSSEAYDVSVRMHAHWHGPTRHEDIVRYLNLFPYLNVDGRPRLQRRHRVHPHDLLAWRGLGRRPLRPLLRRVRLQRRRCRRPRVQDTVELGSKDLVQGNVLRPMRLGVEHCDGGCRRRRRWRSGVRHIALDSVRNAVRRRRRRCRRRCRNRCRVRQHCQRCHIAARVPHIPHNCGVSTRDHARAS